MSAHLSGAVKSDAANRVTGESVETPRRRVSASGRVRAILALGTVLGIGTVLTLAAWTDDGTAAATFSTGSVDLQLNSAEGNPTAYDFATLSMSGMKDGSVKYGGLIVKNNGTLGFTYTMANTVTGDSGLASALRLTVVTTAGTTCDATTFAGGTALIATSALNGAGVAITTPRALAASATENLCFKIELPSGSSNSVQAKSSTASFAFTATQQ